MDSNQSAEITGMLKAWSAGDPHALDRLTAALYQELRVIARRYMRSERAGHSMQVTGLVNELYLRLVNVRDLDWQHRAQFFALVGQLMRRILVDAARSRGSAKRGGGAVKLNIDDVPAAAREPERFIVALDEALEALAKLAPRQAKVVELRYFAGLTEEEIAETLETTSRTVRRDWQFAKTWLMRDLSAGADA